jgi:predicted RNA-binding Zn-ribbon protein involved in translation (DUF1610 family)
VTTHTNNQKLHPTPGQAPLAPTALSQDRVDVNTPYGEHIRLRAAMTAMDREVSLRTESNDLVARWATLVEILALEPQPIVRPCPFCGQMVMRDAVRCRDCWKKLSAAPSESSERDEHATT